MQNCHEVGSQFLGIVFDINFTETEALLDEFGDECETEILVAVSD